MENKAMKVLIHASAFFAPILVPILTYFLSSDEEVKRISLQALLFQVLLWAAGIIAIILVIFLVGIILVPIVALLGMIIPIIGIVKVLQDEHWEYPVVKNWI